MIKRIDHLCALVVLAAALMLGGCSIESDRSEKPSPDWSRGLRLGRTSLRQPVALQVDSDRHVHLVWCDDGLRYAQLDEQAHVLINERLGIDLPSPRKPQLLVDGEDTIHLAWLSRAEGIQELYHVSIDQGATTDGPVLVSWEGQNVSGFQMYLSPSAGVEFIWAGEFGQGSSALAHTTLQDPDRSTTLVPDGIDPYVLVDDKGTVHVAWLQERGYTARSVYYATLNGTAPDLQVVPAGGHNLASFEFSESGVYQGPIIGLDTDNTYVLWSIQNLGGGLTPTAAFSYRVSFRHGAPELANPRAIGLPPASRPDYIDYTSPYGFTQISPLSPDERVFSSDFVNSPATVPSLQAELPVAFSLLTQSEATSQIQLATAILSKGEQVGYQLASKTGNASLMPAITTDPDTYLHLAWIDTAGFKEFDVYYASNAPEARNWLDRTSSEDIVLGAADLVFGLMSGIGLLPIAAIWSFPPLVWVVVFFIFSGQEELMRTLAKVGFAIAIVLYAGMKLLLLPGLFRGTPFLYLVPREWATFTGMAVPAFILGVALAAVYLYSRRSERATIFKGYLIFALVDVLLTLGLYAPGFFGAG